MKLKEYPASKRATKVVCDGCGDVPPLYKNQSPTAYVEYCLGCMVIRYGKMGITAEYLEDHNVEFLDHLAEAKKKALIAEDERNRHILFKQGITS